MQRWPFVNIFFSFFTVFLSGHRVYGLSAGKLDHQAVGQTYDLRSGGAETPVHAVVIRAIRFRDRHSPVFYGDGIAAVGAFHRQLLIRRQLQNIQKLSVRPDLHLLCLPAGKQQQQRLLLLLLALLLPRPAALLPVAAS